MEKHMSNQIKFLGTFDPDPPAPTGSGQPQGGGQANQAPSPPAPPAAAPPPEASIPVSALSAVLQATTQAADDARTAALARVPAPASAPAPAPPAAPTSDDDDLKALRRDVAKLTRDLEQSRLEAYRLQAINNARAGGHELIDALVYGRNTAEIDASIQIAIAEYRLVESRVAQQLQTQIQQQIQQQVPTQQQAAPPQGVVSSVGGQPVAPPQQQQQQVAPPSGPSFLRVPGLPEGQGDITPEQLHYLTTTGVRTGEYARFRNQIHAALRGGMQGPPAQSWGLSSHSVPVAPPASPMAPAAPMAGIQQPQFPVHPSTRAPVPQSQHPAMFGGRPPQPADLESGALMDMTAVTSAAAQAIQSMRGKASGLPPTH